jgi:hypothetical protein
MPADCELSHQRAERRRPAAGKLTAAALQTGLSLGVLSASGAAQASLLTPVLNLMRPQLENRISGACQQWASGGNASLEAQIAPACRALAGPTSRCLVEETERSGRSLGVVTELLAGRFGDDIELVVKRCAGRMLGLPADSFLNVPIRSLADRFKAAAAPALRP